MIFGIGTDLLNAQRVEHVYRRFGERFVDRLLLPEEKKQFLKVKRKARFLAMRFAGKEAVVKAMGTGFSHGVWIRDVGIVQDARGKPEIVFSVRGLAVCRRLGIGGGFVSLSDQDGMVLAMAVLMKDPDYQAPGISNA
ncbi:MAG: holo-ACP synthase [Proteobacteria bacterium]|nr:holo-ACP synthase [Pseudomonadota bacterium]